MCIKGGDSINKKQKNKFIWPVILGLIAAGVIIAVMLIPVTMTGRFSHTIEYDEAELFPDGYDINATWVKPLGLMQLCSDKGLYKPVSAGSTFSVETGGNGKSNICSIDFECSKRARELYLNMPEYLVVAALAEPIVTDITEAFLARPGEITEIPVYDGDKLIYTLTLCWNETTSDTLSSSDKDMAILVTPEAGQEYNIEGNPGSYSPIRKEHISNIVLNRLDLNGIIYDGGYDKEKARCEELLGIDADDLSDNHGLFLCHISEESFIQSLMVGVGEVFRIEGFVKRFDGYTETVNPRDYTTE